jgi:SAM-dependent methyltransferase
MTNVRACPICGSDTLTPYLHCTDHALTKQVFLLNRCENCQLLITSPRPSDLELPRYYDFPEYVSHSGKSSSALISIFYRLARSLAINWKRSVIEKEVKSGRVLDVGCGTGEFLLAMQQHGWKTYGVEPSPHARMKAETLTNQTIYSSLADLPPGKYDIITLWHVLEHLPDLINTIKELRQSLAENGVIYFAAPNHQAYDAQKYAAYWAGYDVPRHLWHFTKASMLTLLEKNNLYVYKIFPMKLDAYYVSYLSEQYLNPGQFLKNILRALISGSRSNRKARKHLNYSSLIFLARTTR